MADFDFQGALQAGYSNEEILRHLAAQGTQPDRLQQLKGKIVDARARNIRLGDKAGQFGQAPFPIDDPERAKQRLFGDYQDPSRPGPAAPPKPDLPWEMRWQQQGEKRAGQPFDLLDSVLDEMMKGTALGARGIEKLSGPSGTPREAISAGRDLIGAGMGLSAPLMLQSAVANPLKTAAVLGGAGAAQKVVEGGTEAAGLDPDTAGLLGDVTGLAVGGMVHGALPKGPEAPRVGFSDWREAAGDVARGAGDLYRGAEDVLNYSGGNPERGAFSRKELTGPYAPQVTPVRGNIPEEFRAAQQAEMDPRRLEKLEEVRSKNPAIRGASSYMTPMEAGKMAASAPNVEAVQRLLDALPSAAHMAALATAGKAKRGWYRASTQAILDVFGMDDAPRFASLLASMSPQTSVESNLQNALNMWRNWTKQGRPTDPESIKFLMGQSVQGKKGLESVLGAWEGNAIRSLSARDPLKVTLSGPKVDSFYRNLLDDVHRGTLDAWMANGLGVNQGYFSGSSDPLRLAVGDPGIMPGYIATNARLRQGANAAKMHTSEAQESIWSLVMPLYEMQKKTGMPAREILDKGLLTPRIIRGTPDFSTLLRDPQYARILEQAGYGDQLAALKAYKWPRAEPLSSLTTAEQRYVDQTAATLERLGADRGRESRSRVTVPGEDRPSEVFAYATPEQVSNVHLPGMRDATIGSKKVYSADVSAPFEDITGRDVAYDALGMNPLETRPAVTGSEDADMGQALKLFPLVEGKKTASGFTVRDEIPNQDSISGSLDDYDVLPGVRDVPMNLFSASKPYSVRGARHVDNLAKQIRSSGELNPLIVAIDKEGARQPYILEGGNRFDALQQLGVKSFPAQVVIDRSADGGRPRPGVNPSRAIGVPAPVNRRGDLDIPQWFKDKLNAVEAARAAMTGAQEAKWNAQIPSKEGTSLFYPAEGKAKADKLAAAAASKAGDYDITDVGAGRAIMNWGKEALSEAERDRLLGLIGETKLKPGKKPPQPFRTQSVSDRISYAEEWAKEPGSGAVTRKMFDYLDKLKEADFNKLDRALRGVAGDLVNTYRQKSKSLKQPVREDLINMLGIMREKGLDGVRQSLKSGGYLPAIALAVLGSAGRQSPSEPASERAPGASRR